MVWNESHGIQERLGQVVGEGPCEVGLESTRIHMASVRYPYGVRVNILTAFVRTSACDQSRRKSRQRCP